MIPGMGDRDARVERPVRFRPLTEADVPLLEVWWRQPHVARWWDGPITLDGGVRQWLAVLEGEPIGYVQSYQAAACHADGWWLDVDDPGIHGIDQFLADPNDLGRGLGTKMVRAFVAELFADPRVTRVQADPSPANARAIRCYEKAGFGRVRQIVTPDGPALLMQRDRVERGYAPVNGLRMYYEIHGNPADDGVPLVLLHGGGSTIETSFGELIPLLSKARRVIALEQQGHGHTADVDRPFSFEQSADDTVALLRHLHIGKADFFGYSNGGHTALEIALRHPQVVRAIVLESMFFSRDGTDPRFWKSFDRAKLEDMPAELRDAYLSTAPSPGLLPSFFEKSVQRMRDFKGWTPAQIRSVRAPVLLVLGDRDIVRVEHAAQMQNLLSGAWLAVLPATDHMAIPHRAASVAPIVDEFLRAASATANNGKGN
jgi:pimeloyl-ACP methyl ester carboxylesterase/RimJ/RimL family protein N-acetyltransferase